MTDYYTCRECHGYIFTCGCREKKEAMEQVKVPTPVPAEPVKLIFHCHSPANLNLMARSAQQWLGENMYQGSWRAHRYGNVLITAIKRKACLTIYDQPVSEERLHPSDSVKT